MKQLKHFLLMAAMLMCSFAASGRDFTVNGIYYNITSEVDRTVEVTSNPNKYSYYITVPTTVIYNGLNYRVTSIGDDAFYKCSSLTAIIIPASVTSIGEYAFEDCSSLTTITLPENSQLTSIGDYAFYKCSSLTAIIIPASVTSIGDYAFEDCSGELTVNCNIPSPSSYSNGAFYNSQFTKVTIGEGVTSIGDYAFYKCSSLTSITIPGNSQLTSIGKYAFRDCSSLTAITIPDGVTSIGYGAFSGCCSLTTIVVAGGNANYDSRIGCNAIIETNSNTLVVGCSSTTIPESVTSIGSYAFNGCSSPVSITIPESVTSIGSYAFNGCSGELTVNCNIPSASSYSNGAFYNSQFTKVTIGEGVTSIGDYAFAYCANLKEIIIEDGSEDLFLGCNGSSEGLFYYCPLEEVYLGRNLNYSSGQPPFYKEKLTTLTIGESVTSIGDYAFFGCSSLTTITLPENSQLTSIGDYAFYKCSSLTAIIIPASVTSIGEYAFEDCSSLTAITIPDGVTSIGYCAFYNCCSLTTIVVAGGNANYDSRIGCNAIIETNSNTLVVGCSSTTIPEGVTSIGDYAFSGCSSPVSITIPESVTSIGERAFEDCSGELTVNCNIPSASSYSNGAFYNSQFTKVTIGEGVTSIGDYAFAYCDSLTSITIPEKVTSIGEYAFRGCANLGKVINFSNLDIQKGGADNGHIGYYAYAVIKIDEVVGDYCFCTLNGNVYSLSYYVGKKTALSLPEDYKGEDYTIGDYAFADNDEIVSVVIPSAASAIGNSAFAGCAKLASVTISRGMMIVGDSAFMDCANLSSVFLPQSVTSVGEKAFGGCSGMTSLSIGENVDDLKGNAFNGCTAVEVLAVKGSVMPVVPSSKLTSITLYSPVPLKTTEFATKVYRNAVVYVPQGSQARYQAADVWKNFWAIKEFDPTGIEGIKTTESVEAPIYDMKGMPISGTRDSLPAGLYIQNGKKFVVM